MKKTNVKFYVRFYARFRSFLRPFSFVFTPVFVRFYARFRSFIVLKQTNGYVFITYFFLIVYKRVPFSSVVTSSKAGSIAFTNASNHVW